MYKKAILFLMAAAAGICLSAGEKTFEFINDNGFSGLHTWHPTGHSKAHLGGIRRIVPNGRFGSCMELKNTAKSHCGAYSMYSLGIDVRKDVIEGGIYVKGKGIVDVSFLLYKKNGSVGGVFHKRFNVNSPDQWKKLSFKFTSADFRGKVPGEMNARFSLQYLSPGSLFVDDFSAVIFSK